MKYLLYLSFISAVLLTACKQNQKKSSSTDVNTEQASSKKEHDHSMHEHAGSDHHGHDHGDNPTHKRSLQIDKSNVQNPILGDLIDTYIELKNGLVADDKEAAAKSASGLIDRFKSLDRSDLKPEQLKAFDEIVENATEQVEHIAKSDIAHQREHFEILTVDMQDLIILLGTDKTLYESFCPMANKGKGAVWLSETKEIRNPYFGSKMLKCGKVTRQIN